MRKVSAILAVIGLTVLLGSGCSSFLQGEVSDPQRSLEQGEQVLSQNASQTASSLAAKAIDFSNAIAPDGTRFALVIGNGKYQKTTPLANPPTDATDVAKLLEDVGFTVTLQTDASLSQMEGTIREFANEAKKASAETTLFYYAGHGVQFEGTNYLLPVNADIHKDYELRSKAVSMELVSSALNETDSDFNLILLDACRDNPFASSRGGARGLMAMGGGNSESMVVFSTSPGSVAQDGDGSNSPFTTALKQHLLTPDQEVRQLVASVSKSVQTMTKGRQIPWVNTSFTGSFYFVTAEQQLMRADADAMRLKDELAALESEIAKRQAAMATETDALTLQRMQIEQQRTKALEASKKLDVQRMEQIREQAEYQIAVQQKEQAEKRVLEATVIGQQEELARQASGRRAELAKLDQQRSLSSDALERLDLIAKMEKAMADIEQSFALSITSTKEELASLQQQQVDSYKTTNAQDPWESQAEFTSRVTGYRSDLVAEGEARIREIERQRDTEIGKIRVQLEQAKRELKNMRFTLGPASTKVTVAKFDAVNKRFPIQVTSTDSSFPFDVSVSYSISSSDREELKRGYERIDNAEKAQALVGELTYALKEANSGIWSAYVVSGKMLNLLEGSKEKPGVVASISEGTGSLGRDVFFLAENGEVRPLIAVDLDQQGGTGGSTSAPVVYGSAMPSAAAPQRNGYIFEGYYDQVNGGGKQYYTRAMGSARNWDRKSAATLYAKWRVPSVGEFGPAGGYVFYDKGSYSDGWRYMEAAPAEYEFANKVWGGYGTSVGNTATGIGTGKGNTEKIVSKFGYAEPSGKKTDYAAKLCSDLKLTKDGVVYDDWFLPSKDELNKMYQNLYKNKLGGFSGGYYWSSSGGNTIGAWKEYFNNGNQYYYDYRYNNYRVRPVRAF